MHDSLLRAAKREVRQEGSRKQGLGGPRPCPRLQATHGTAEGQEQLEDDILGEGWVPGHQVNEALQSSPPSFDEFPVS